MELDLRIVPIDIYGVKMWSVEDRGGFTYAYCDTKPDAQRRIDAMQEGIYNLTHIRLNS